jgi:exopolysaccharide production protein ExoZ
MLEEQSNKPFLISIQVLRSIAALCIVIAHSITEIHQAGASFPSLPFDFGIGVDIFFVVSGFVMVLTGSKRPENPSASVEFLRRRLIRVAPLYWFYTSAMLFAIWLVPNQLNNGNISAPLVACSYIFLPCLNESGQYSPVLALGWTLNCEIFFCLIFALALLGRGGTAWFYRLSALLLISVAFGPVVGGVWNFWGNPIILEFVVGAVLALIFIDLGLVQSRAAFLLAVAISTGLYVVVTQELETRFLELVIPAIIFLTKFILDFSNAWERRINGQAYPLGYSSYGLYRSHPFTRGILKFLTARYIFYYFCRLLNSSRECIVWAILAADDKIHFEFAAPKKT